MYLTSIHAHRKPPDILEFHHGKQIQSRLLQHKKEHVLHAQNWPKINITEY